MAGLLVAIGIMGIMLSAALPVWSQSAKRSREAELVFRGEQYARAIELYQRQYVGAYPPDLETLIEQRFLRRLYRDPMTEDGLFQVVYRAQVEEIQGLADRQGESTTDEPGIQETTEAITFGPNDESGGVVGVVSKSDEESLRVYNGRQKYSEWAFVYVAGGTDAGAAPADVGVQPSRRGLGGVPVGEDSGRFNLDGPR